MTDAAHEAPGAQPATTQHHETGGQTTGHTGGHSAGGQTGGGHAAGFSNAGAVPPVGQQAVQGPNGLRGRQHSPSDRAYGADGGGLVFDAAQRAELISGARFRLGQAYTAFTGACGSIELEMYAAAQESAEVISLIASTLFGMALPGIGALIGRAAPGAIAALSGAFPAAMRHTIQEIAPEMITEAAKGAGEGAIQTVVDGVGPVSRTEDANAFVHQMNANMQLGNQNLSDRLPGMSDLMLYATYLAYDARIATEAHYIPFLRSRCEALKALQRMGSLVGPPSEAGNSYQELMYVGDPARGTANPLYMCLRTDTYGLFGLGARHDYTVDQSSRVPEDMREVALEIYAHRTGNAVPKTITGDGAEAVPTMSAQRRPAAAPQPTAHPAPHPAAPHPSPAPQPNIYGGLPHRG